MKGLSLVMVIMYLRQKYELKSLRHQLDSAIQAENFEDAAILRDKIKELEAIIGGNKE